jgi:O-antigen/teichoic acid export membrane protein
MLPLLTRYLSKEEYGILAMFQVMVTLLIPLIGLSTNGAVAVKFYKLTEEEHSNFVLACIVLVAICFVVVFIFVRLFQVKISQWTSIPVGWLWAPSVFVLCQGIINIALANWQVRLQSVHYGLFLILNTLINFSLSLLFVVFLHFDWTGRVLGQLLAGILFAMFALFSLKKSGEIKLGSIGPHISAAIAFGIPLVPNYLLSTVTIITGRLLINNMIGTEETGVYSVGNQIASILLIIAASFNLAYAPWLYERLKENVYERKIMIVRVTYVYFVIATLAAIALGVSSAFVLPFLVGSKFTSADHYIIWFALGFAFNGMYMMVVNYIFYVEKVVWITLITIPASILNLFLSYYLIHARGGVGAAQAQAVIAVIGFIGTWIVAGWVYPMPWFKKEVFTGLNLGKNN